LATVGRRLRSPIVALSDDRAALDHLGLEPRDAAIRYAYYVRDSEDIYVFVLAIGEENPRWIKLGGGEPWEH
jgi:hypothetical protein